MKDDGAPADPLKLLKESLDIVRKNPSMLDESGRKEAAQLLKQWETAITLIAEDVEKEPADNSEIRGSAIEKAKKAHKKASQMLMSSALKSEEEAGAIKKEVQDLEAKSAALLKQAEALADEGKDEKAELILAEAESLLEVASEMEAEAKFLNAKAAQDKESAVEAKQEEVGDVPKDENGIPFDSVEGQTRTLGGQLMTALMASVLKEPVNRMRQEAAAEAARKREEKLKEREAKKKEIIARRQNVLKTSRATASRATAHEAAKPVHKPASAPAAADDVNHWLAPPPACACPPGPTTSSAPSETADAPVAAAGAAAPAAAEVSAAAPAAAEASAAAPAAAEASVAAPAAEASI